MLAGRPRGKGVTHERGMTEGSLPWLRMRLANTATSMWATARPRRVKDRAGPCDADLHARRVRCGDFVSLDPNAYGGCRCAIYKDRDAGRFGSSLGDVDASIEIYRGKARPTPEAEAQGGARR